MAQKNTFYEVWVGTPDGNTGFAHPEGHDGQFEFIWDAEEFAKSLTVRDEVHTVAVIERKVVRRFPGRGRWMKPKEEKAPDAAP